MSTPVVKETHNGIDRGAEAQGTGLLSVGSATCSIRSAAVLYSFCTPVSVVSKIVTKILDIGLSFTYWLPLQHGTSIFRL